MISIRPTGVVNEVEKPKKEENKKYLKDNENTPSHNSLEACTR